MITSQDCLKKYGAPELEKNMTVWTPPRKIKTIPNRIYCNRDLITPLNTAIGNVIDRGLSSEIRTWDGCFNIRKKRGGNSISLHSWGIAIDINAAWNRFGQAPTMSKALVKCFVDAGFDWGGRWVKPDGQHFQLSRLP